MTGVMTQPTTGGLARIDGSLVRLGVIGGLLGGVVLFVVMAVFNAARGQGFWSILNACFASFVYPNAGMAEPMMGHAGHGGMTQGMSGHGMMNSGPIVASHLVVGAVLHVAMSVAAGVAFVVVLAILLRAGVRPLARPLGYLAAAVAGGALLFAIMMYVVAPVLNSEIADFTPRVPFFLAHLLFGATVAGYAYQRRRQTTRPSPST